MPAGWKSSGIEKLTSEGADAGPSLRRGFTEFQWESTSHFKAQGNISSAYFPLQNSTFSARFTRSRIAA